MGHKILVVDDHPQLVELVKIRLEAAGMEVIPAYDGQEGLSKARKDNPDLIILDVMLPKMNGFKLCRLLKFDRKFSHIPIVMLSSRAKESDAEMGMETGADEYLFKPFDPKRLIEVVKRLLGNKKIETKKEEEGGDSIEEFSFAKGFSVPEKN